VSDATHDELVRRRLENLQAVYQSMQAPARATTPSATEPEAPLPARRSRLGALGALGAVLVFLAGKLKFLGFLASVLKLKTLGTMLLSVGAYATQWGWPFALGFVLLIFVHELGHAIVLRREGIAAGAPVFIPFVGAFITMQGMPRDAYVEAKVAIGGPVLGSLGAWALLIVAVATGHPFLAALAQVGILINLFNLIPVSPLDGGRVAGAFSRPFWIAGYALGLAALFVIRSPILAIVLVIGLVTLWRQWNHPVPGYHAIPRAQRLAIGLGYAALLLALIATLPIAHGLAVGGMPHHRDAVAMH
jgi:Zn-dependent protease